MLPSSDELLLARYPEIPGLRVLLDEQRLSAWLRERLPLDEADRVSLTWGYLRLKPGSSCLVGYRGSINDQIFHAYGKAHAVINAVKMDKLRSQPVVDTAFGPGRLLDESLLLQLSFFPNDAGLRGLRRLVRQIPAIDILAYKPERRFVGRMNAGRSQQVVKLYKSTAYAQSLQRASLASSLGYLPRLCGRDERNHALYFQWKDGQTLSELLYSDGRGGASLGATGKLLAQLHGESPDPQLPERRRAHWSARLTAMTEGLCQLLPEHTVQLTRLLQQLMAAIDQIPHQPVLVHGDFYSNQVLLSSATSVSLLDCDELALANAESDVGLFLAHLEFDVLRKRLSAQQADSVGREFVAGYVLHQPLDRNLLALFTVIGMMSLAHRPFRDSMPDWPATTRSWIASMETIFQAGGEWLSAASQVQASEIPQLMQLFQPETATTTVLPILRETQGGQAHWRHLALQLVRLKPGRRALVNGRLYAAEPERFVDLVIKIRAKGFDAETYRINQWLYQHHWREGASLVPQPLGACPPLGLWMQERVRGRDGWQCLWRDDALAAMESVGRSLAQLHRSPLTLHRQHGVEDELEILTQAIRLLQQQQPALQHRLARLLELCHAVAVGLERRPAATIHRDFYPDQVVVTTDRTVLLDLDLVASGDPALDLGNYLAHVQEWAFRLHGDAFMFDTRFQVLLDSYRQHAGSVAGAADAVERYRLLSLARLVCISARFDDRRPFTQDLLAFCLQQFKQSDVYE